MDPTSLIAVAREALLLMLVASAPPLLASLVVGFIASALQAVTSIQEPTLSSVPRLIAALLVLGVAGPSVGAQLGRFTSELFAALPLVSR